MLIFGLCLLYIGLQLIDYMFGLHWEEFSIGVTLLALVITILCYIDSMMIAGTIWLVVTLIEYRTYLKYIKN